MSLLRKINAKSKYGEFDTNGDSEITASELAKVTGIPLNEAKDYIKKYDTNKNMTLDSEEFEDLKDMILAQQRLSNHINSKMKLSDIDKNGDGKVSAAELAKVCGITRQQAREIIKKVDKNGNNYLDQDEFLVLKNQILSQQRQKIKYKIKPTTTIKSMDKNSDGKLSAAELSKATNITLKEAEEIIGQYDKNGDGFLDAAEFKDLKDQILSQQTKKLISGINENTNFKDIDKNGDKTLTAKELSEAVNISLKKAEALINKYDKNKDHVLDSSEFADLKKQILGQQTQKILSQIKPNTTICEIVGI